MTTPVLEQETQGGVRVLRLNRPERKNALNDELGWALVAAFEAAAADPEVRAIGLTGAGDAFCSGVDLGKSESRSPLDPASQAIDDLSWVGRFPLVIRVACDKPVIAGVNGIAIGAGLSLAMCADIRIAGEGARFHPGYARAGTSPDGGLSWTLPQAIGHEKAIRFLLEQEMVSAEDALDLGLVSQVEGQDDFDPIFRDYCERMAQVAPLAARQTKRMVTRAGLGIDLEDFLPIELSYARRGLASEDGREAVQAILEKRSPNFRGR